ncbi:MAG: carboxypeptidase-like regulatory domain-containing protein, partial [Duncaniella sp.]|nr:carboxypeptidase-like regulatory domain-containing protein [Duncaniella sp.]
MFKQSSNILSRLRFLFTLSFVAFAAAGAGAVSVGSVRVGVKVIDAATSSALEFVAVSLDGGKQGGIRGGYTDSNGVFSLDIPEGEWTVDVSMVGYKPLRRVCRFDHADLITIPLESVDALDEVVVTAREARNTTSASLIDTTAMRHLQPSSFSDLMALLPGGTTKDPEMGAVNSIALRQASGITPTDDYATAA